MDRGDGGHRMTKGPNSLRRTTGGTTVTLVWPADRKDWDSLPAITRKQIREALDTAVDLIERWS